MNSMIGLILAGLAIAPAAAQTVDAGSRFGIGVTAGTLGVGPEASFRLSPPFGVRANAGFLSIHHNFKSDDIKYRGKVKLKSGGAMLDLYPFGGGFRVSAGARINGNGGSVTATPESEITINDIEYTPAEVGTLRGKAETKNFAPALSLGYGGSMRSGLMFGVEAGALFQGKVRIRRFTASGGGVNPADLEAERVSIQDDVDDYKIYPILQLILAYRF